MRPASGGRRGMTLLDIGAHAPHVVRCLLEGDARLQARDRLEIADVAIDVRSLDVDGRGRDGLAREDPELGHRGPFGPRRHDPDDGVRLAVEPDASSDRILRAVEHPLPDGIADNDHRLGRRRVLRSREHAAGGRTDAEDVEEVDGDPVPFELVRVPVADHHGEDGVAIPRHRGKRAVLALKVEEVARRMSAAAFVVRRRPDLDDTPGVMERQRAEEHAVDHAEDRGVRGDADRDRQDRDGRKVGVFARVRTAWRISVSIPTSSRTG